ncbi:hypothetical protein WOLCODRAFT_24864 [Wolfiporia cocos MD-104 SS10]|uniref:Ferritin-like domain-containing protein n=1 Tax=Wolfiporia cocos (strain MD-104) TaxID=742152 RepID=A0A2H3JHF3_WOLCO|nr:hypothetical protein WOLCODRAFT_24864 [Wolfiporia cocos MD-104 SS10]
MFPSLSVLALAVPLLVSGAPIHVKRANSTDVLVLQFAGVLEQLESEFYSQALAKFQDSDFTSAGFSDAQVPIQQFEAIGSDEATHLSVINSTLESLGASLISGCQFDFSDVLSNVSTMAATARVVENLGVAAYLGAANMITDPVLLTAAASIMSVEARHQTVLNLLSDATSIPQAFDIALTPSEVLAVASPFISGCEIPIQANPTLTVTNTGPAVPGTALTFTSSALNGSTDGLFCQMLVGGAATSISLNLSSCVVPDGINGPVAIFITSDDQPINNNIREQNTNFLVAGPTMVFVDANSDLLGQLAVTGSVSSNSTSSSNSSSSGSVSSSAASATSTSGSDSNSTAVASSTATASATSAASVSSSASEASATAVSVSASFSATAAASAASASATTELTSVITSTISPSQASVIISAASAAASETASTAASATESASAALASAGSSTDIVAFPGGPNMYVGPSADGSIYVLGWSTTSA